MGSNSGKGAQQANRKMVIEDFLTRYRHEIDFYEKAGRLAAQLIETNLHALGIRGIVTSRAKSLSRLREKLRERNKTRPYGTIEDIYSDIVDLAGVRVALYFPTESQLVSKVITEKFELLTGPIVFPKPTKQQGEAIGRKPRFDGYHAIHFRVRLKEPTLDDLDKRYSGAAIEIQVASVLMHAWAEVEHDLVYKPLRGKLSQEELAILDELNGLVIAGEIALEQLQLAGERRVSTSGQRILNHYELAAYLLKQAPELARKAAPDLVVGRVDLLYALLAELGLDTIAKIQSYVSQLHGRVEERALSDQITDLLLEEDKDRYKAYEKLWPAFTDSVDSKAVSVAIGQFLTKWTKLERFVSDRTNPKGSGKKQIQPTYKLFRQLEIADSQTRAEIDKLRSIRNALVHGVDVPSVRELENAAILLERVISKLAEEWGPTKKD